MIFRLFNTDELGRIWVIEECKIGKHLESSIRSKLCQNRLIEWSVFYLEKQSSIGKKFRLNLVKSRDTLLEYREDFFQTLRMLFVKVLNDIGKIISCLGQMFLRACLGNFTCMVGCEV